MECTLEVALTVPASQMNFERVQKLLSLASRETTNDNEALSALRMARASLQAGGFDLSQLVLPMGDSLFNRLVKTPVVEWTSRIATLEQEAVKLRETIESLQDEKIQNQSEIKRLNDTIASLQRSLAGAQRRVAATGVKPKDGFYTWAQFRRAVVDQIQRETDWQTIYSAQTGIERGKLQQWRQRDRVAAEHFDLVANLTVVPKERERQRWTEAEYNRLAELVGEGGRTERELATMLSEEFGRPLTTNSIVGAKDRLRKKSLA